MGGLGGKGGNCDGCGGGGGKALEILASSFTTGASLKLLSVDCISFEFGGNLGGGGGGGSTTGACKKKSFRESRNTN